MRTVRATVHLATLSTPAAIQLRAIIALFKFTTVVEIVTSVANQSTEHGVRTHTVFILGRAAQVAVTG